MAQKVESTISRTTNNSAVIAHVTSHAPFFHDIQTKPWHVQRRFERRLLLQITKRPIDPLENKKSPGCSLSTVYRLSHAVGAAPFGYPPFITLAPDS